MNANRAAARRSVFRWVGEIFVTLGVILALFVVYLLWWTGVQTAFAQDDLSAKLDQATSASATQQPPGSPSAANVDPPPAVPAVGEPYVRIQIPALGADFNWVVVEGVDLPQLKLGPGHYPGTQGPGEIGNSAVAAHRAGHGGAFADLDRVKPGDEVHFSVGDSHWTYRVDRTFLTEASDIGVILPVPEQPGAVPTKRLMTLTTCDPKYGVRFQRLIVVGSLVEEH